jgi:hypothetical protein
MTDSKTDRAFGRLARTLRPIACLIFVIATACATRDPCPQVAIADPVYIVSQGWHVEIGLPADRVQGPLAVYRDIFPGARSFMFGFGKRTFMTGPTKSPAEYLVGPFPGPAVIQVTGLSVMPPDAYGPGGTITMSLPPGGAEGLSDFIWNDLQKDKVGLPRLVGLGHHPGTLVYDAKPEYSLIHTCNAWAADALAAAHLPISGEGVVFSGQAMGRAETARAAECAAAPGGNR